MVQREYRWLALQDDQHELRQRKAVLAKVREQQRLREEAHALHVQQRTLQHQLKEVREQMSTNRQQLAAAGDTEHSTLAYPADAQTAIADETTLPVYVTSK